MACNPLVTVAPFPTCIGDCNEDDRVTIDELVRGVTIALGKAELSECPLLNPSGDGQVAVNEIVRAVNAALFDCSAQPAL